MKLLNLTLMKEEELRISMKKLLESEYLDWGPGPSDGAHLSYSNDNQAYRVDSFGNGLFLDSEYASINHAF